MNAEGMTVTVDHLVNAREGTSTLDKAKGNSRVDRPIQWKGRDKLSGGLPSQNDNEGYPGGKTDV